MFAMLAISSKEIEELNKKWKWIFYNVFRFQNELFKLLYLVGMTFLKKFHDDSKRITYCEHRRTMLKRKIYKRIKNLVKACNVSYCSIRHMTSQVIDSHRNFAARFMHSGERVGSLRLVADDFFWPASVLRKSSNWLISLNLLVAFNWLGLTSKAKLFVMKVSNKILEVLVRMTIAWIFNDNDIIRFLGTTVYAKQTLTALWIEDVREIEGFGRKCQFAFSRYSEAKYFKNKVNPLSTGAELQDSSKQKDKLALFESLG